MSPARVASISLDEVRAHGAARVVDTLLPGVTGFCAPVFDAVAQTPLGQETSEERVKQNRSGAEVAEQGRVDPAAFDQVEPRCNADAAGDLDAVDDGFEEGTPADAAAAPDLSGNAVDRIVHATPPQLRLLRRLDGRRGTRQIEALQGVAGHLRQMRHLLGLLLQLFGAPRLGQGEP